ncbi:MAG: D-alanine--D-alanine ligase [Firmicutes bacterium]|nr:D-alanine--D-alanine ligase [Bacillota bacterium]
MRKLRVGVIFGGRSGEHEVSLMSAQSVIQAIDRQKYEVVPIGITRDGRWIASGDPMRALLEGRPGLSAPAAVLPQPGAGLRLTDGGSSGRESGDAAIDVFFPVLHGPYGEDGTIQGLLELAGAPYVGSGVAASAAGMDKAMMKALFQQAGLPVVPYVVVVEPEWRRDAAAVRARLEAEIGYPCFVKPANMGSSVGVSRVTSGEGLGPALERALRYDRKVLVEQEASCCREVEVGVLGNDDPEASVPGEVVPAGDFYDYRAKYLDDRSELIIPARIGPKARAAVRDIALRAFRAIDGAGLARVDFFVHKETERVWVNEINTMPGFTRMSMFPKLWEASGLPYDQLIDRLIQLALERHGQRARLETRPEPAG